jgi:hypothetical protein
VSIENARRLSFIGRYVESGTQTPQNPLSEISGDDEFPADAVRASLTDQLVWPIVNALLYSKSFISSKFLQSSQITLDKNQGRTIIRR